MLPRAASIIFGTVLRAAGDTKTPMKIGVLVNLINVVLNFLLIYPSRTITILGVSLPMWGADMGVVGAALATLIARMAEFSAKIVASSPDELKTHVAAEIAKWGPVVKDANVQMD